MAGGEFGEGRGVHGTDYIYPAPGDSANGDLSVWQSAGLNTYRLPFWWERLQPASRAELDAAELALLRTTVQAYSAYGHVILDLHNFGRYGGGVVTGPQPANDLADFWVRLLGAMPDSDRIIVGLMNEPHDIDAATWAAEAQRAVSAIRAAGHSNLILVPGTNWSGAHSWNDGSPSNATALASLRDPLNNLAFEAHQYLDSNSAGHSEQCVGPDEAVARLQPFTAWLKQTGHRGFLGELGASPAPACVASLEAMLDHIDANSEYIGWTYWASGPWWPDDYPFLVRNDGGAYPQLDRLKDHGCR